jgi:hypothetical protein
MPGTDQVLSALHPAVMEAKEKECVKRDHEGAQSPRVVSQPHTASALHVADWELCSSNSPRSAY